jgi:hypothetical protein
MWSHAPSSTYFIKIHARNTVANTSAEDEQMLNIDYPAPSGLPNDDCFDDAAYIMYRAAYTEWLERYNPQYHWPTGRNVGKILPRKPRQADELIQERQEDLKGVQEPYDPHPINPNSYERRVNYIRPAIPTCESTGRKLNHFYDSYPNST